MFHVSFQSLANISKPITHSSRSWISFPSCAVQDCALVAVSVVIRVSLHRCHPFCLAGVGKRLLQEQCLFELLTEDLSQWPVSNFLDSHFLIEMGLCNREAQENRKIFSSRSLNILQQLPRRSTPQLHYVFHHECFVTTVTASRASATHFCVTDPNDDPCGVEPTPGATTTHIHVNRSYQEQHLVVVDWLAGWLAGWAGWLVGWLAGWLVGWLAGWLVGWLAGWLLVGGFVGWSVRRLLCRLLPRLLRRLVCQLVGQLVVGVSIVGS